MLTWQVVGTTKRGTFGEKKAKDPPRGLPKEKEIMQKNFSVTTGNKSGTAASVGELYSPTDVTATAQLVFVFRLKVKQSESKIYLGWTKQYFFSFGSVTSSTIKCSLLPLAMRPLAFAVI